MNNRAALPREFIINPKYWPTWLALGTMWSIAQLPYTWQCLIGRTLGRLLYLALKRRRYIAWTNLALCFPELSTKQRLALLQRHFEALGMGAVETAMCWWTPDERLKKLVSIEGMEHLHQALSRGRGAILLSAHFTTTEIGARLLTLFVEFHATYRKHNNPLFDAVMRRARESHCRTSIPRGDVRAMLRSLKDNIPIWYAPDQNHSRRHNIVYAPFFGIPAATITATSRLAEISGAPVVPFFPQRNGYGDGYRLVLQPPLEGFPSGDVTRDTLHINEAIENAVRAVPEQYLWVHRRFKTRPEGEPYIYIHDHDKNRPRSRLSASPGQSPREAQL